MKRVPEKTIIGITGMPGSGKNIVRTLVRESGFPMVVMGDEVRAEAKQRNLDPTPENLGHVMLQIRAEEDPGVLARRCIPKIKASNSRVVIIDGIRSMHEVEEFKREFPDLKVIAIDSSPEIRFKRLFNRGRADDPEDWETFVERDQRELSVGIGEVIASADCKVTNEGTKRQFRDNLEQLFTRELKRWPNLAR